VHSQNTLFVKNKMCFGCEEQLWYVLTCNLA